MTRERRESSRRLEQKRAWEPMEIRYVGHLATVLQSKPGTRGDGGNAVRRSASG